MYRRRSLIRPHPNNASVQIAMREWLRESQRWFTDFVTLASNDPMKSLNGMDANLSEWARRMNRLIVGDDWGKRKDEQNHWMAFIEGTQALPHWHLLFSLSPDLRPSRKCRWQNGAWHEAAQRTWKDICRSGSVDAQPITSHRLDYYVTKELHREDNMLYYRFSESLCLDRLRRGE